MTVSVDLEGFAALDVELATLSKAVGKGAMRRGLKSAAKPMAELMISLVPRGETAIDLLGDSIAIGTKLSRRQSGLHRRMFRDQRASVEMFVGPGPDPAAWNQEFGNVNHGAQPFVRPAWDAQAMPTLDRLGVNLWEEIRKSQARAARKAERQGG